MPKRVPPLTQLQIRNAKPKEKAYKLTDGGGLYLEVTTAGGKHWRMKYRRPDGREFKLNFGAFPNLLRHRQLTDMGTAVLLSMLTGRGTAQA